LSCLLKYGGSWKRPFGRRPTTSLKTVTRSRTPGPSASVSQRTATLRGFHLDFEALAESRDDAQPDAS